MCSSADLSVMIDTCEAMKKFTMTNSNNMKYIAIATVAS